MLHDIIRYRNEFNFGVPFNTFIAAFERPAIESQMDGVASFYRLLANLDLIDSDHFLHEDSNHIDSPDFGLMLGGEKFFIPFFYPFAGSVYRRSDINFLVFNGHKAFAHLRKLGAFDRLKSRIHERMPHAHPNLGDQGKVNQFEQFALVDPDLESQRAEKEIRSQVLGGCPFEHDHTL